MNGMYERTACVNEPSGHEGNGETIQLSLVDVPWPISILKCNQQLIQMPVGAHLDVTLKDPFIKDNLVLLLNAMPGFAFDVRFADECFCLSITKRTA